MLIDAIREIEVCTRADRRERSRRAAARIPLRRAEAYTHQIEELMLARQRRVPADLAQEIRLFVEENPARSASGVSDRVWVDSGLLLDLLFDLQERVQHQMSASASMVTCEATWCIGLDAADG